MLSKEVLKSSITGLTDEQIAAITELSKNDENTVIGNKVREIHDLYDRDFKEVFGYDKPVHEKTYTFWKGEAKKLKDQTGNIGEFQKQIDDLKAEKTKLEKLIKSGDGDTALKSKVDELTQKIADDNTTIAKLRADVKIKEAEFQTKLDQEANKVVELKVNNAFSQVLQGKKFKAGIPQTAIDATIKAAQQSIMAKGKPEFQADDTGKENVIFRDTNGMVITNPENLQKPFTAGEMLLSSIKDILDVGIVQPGGGGSNGSGGKPTMLDLNGVTNRVDADRVVRKFIAAQGLAQGSGEFNAEYQKLYADNKLETLPVK